jgi:hypothetical protein
MMSNELKAASLSSFTTHHSAFRVGFELPFG